MYPASCLLFQKPSKTFAIVFCWLCFPSPALLHACLELACRLPSNAVMVGDWVNCLGVGCRAGVILRPGTPVLTVQAEPCHAPGPRPPSHRCCAVLCCAVLCCAVLCCAWGSGSACCCCCHHCRPQHLHRLVQSKSARLVCATVILFVMFVW